jgi:phosphoribosyl-AMP cyclohydrolase
MANGNADFPAPGNASELEGGYGLTPRFGQDGVLAAVATDADTGEVLMLAWMNAEALALTIRTGEAHFFSRSRQRLWKKGEESGNVLDVVEMRTDCDQDAVWMRVRMRGMAAACHTGHRTCFYRRIPVGADAALAAVSLETAGVPRAFDPDAVYRGNGKG